MWKGLLAGERWRQGKISADRKSWRDGKLSDIVGGVATATHTPTWTIGDRMRKARVTAGIDTDEMANDIGRTRRTISNYESDSTTAPLLVLRQYAVRCGVPLDWLTGADTEANIIGYPLLPVDRLRFAA
jgi:DNA-binding XRE family transcriptional regulator